MPQALLILLGVAVDHFHPALCHASRPGADAGWPQCNGPDSRNIRHELGLDQPLYVQFWHYLSGLVQGDLGRSYAQKTEVATLIWARLPATLVLMAAGITIEVMLGCLLGTTAAVKRGGFVDNLVMMTSFVGVSAPQFVVALLLLYVFAITLGWFPMSGYGTFAHVVLPA